MGKEEIKTEGEKKLDHERYGLLHQLEKRLEVPMVALSIIWVVLIILSLLGKNSSILFDLSNIIWIIFIIDFALRFFLTPQKWHFLKKNWLMALSLLIPAIRIFRIFQTVSFFTGVHAMNSLWLAKLMASMNRGLRSLGATMGRQGVGFVTVATMLVLGSGAAGMYAFEHNVHGGLNSYGDALWWTAMLFTSIGSDYFPQTPEGKVLCLILALYGLAVFGYFTAILATFLLGREAANRKSAVAGSAEISELQNEIRMLRDEIRLSREQTPAP